MLAAPRLLVKALPLVVLAVVIKTLLQLNDIHPLDLNPLLSGLIAATVFMLGFLLSGTLTDYKESERLPGELAAGLESIADECLIHRAETGGAQAQAALEQVLLTGKTIHSWLVHTGASLEDALAAIRAFNPHFSYLAPVIQPGFTTRLKSEQATLRRIAIRIDTIRTTDFIPAGYLIVQLIGLLLGVGMMLTEVSSSTPESAFFVGMIALLISYLYLLIRDLDDPFGYVNGEASAADVSLKPLEQALSRLSQEVAAGATVGSATL